MKRTLLCLLSSGVLCTALLTNTFAQQGQVARQAAPATQPTAAQQQIPFLTVDLAMLMKRHPNLYVQRENMLAQRKDMEAKLQLRQTQLQTEAKELSRLTPGTPGYAQKKDKLVKDEAMLKADAMTLGEQLQTQEIHLLYGVYSDIKASIDMVAKQYGAIVVIPYTPASTILKPSTGEKTIQEMGLEIQLSENSTVIYADPRYNITEAVQAQIDAKYANIGKVVIDPQTLEPKLATSQNPAQR